MASDQRIVFSCLRSCQEHTLQPGAQSSKVEFATWPVHDPRHAAIFGWSLSWSASVVPSLQPESFCGDDVDDDDDDDDDDDVDDDDDEEDDACDSSIMMSMNLVIVDKHDGWFI